MRLLLIAVVVLLGLVSAMAVALHHFFGWKGLVALPFLLIALVWAGKLVIGKLIRRFFLGLFSLKSRVLRGATVKVHSIVAVPKPVESEELEDDSTDAEAGEPDEADETADEEEAEGPKCYYDVDLTVTPAGSCGNNIWEPAELIVTSEKLSSLEDLTEGDRERGTAHSVQIWDGSAFGPDDSGKYPGPQRLKVTFEVKPGTGKAWLHYYDEPIGELEFPAWQPQPQ